MTRIRDIFILFRNSGKYLSVVLLLPILLFLGAFFVYAQTTYNYTITYSASGQGNPDDMAIWVHPTDRSKSTVITADKHGDVFVYDVGSGGSAIQRLTPPGSEPGNIDVRYNFPLGGQSVDIVAHNRREGSDQIVVYKVNADRTLTRIDNNTIQTGSTYGFCLYHSKQTGKFYGFTTSKSGHVEQWELYDAGGGQVDGIRRRTIEIGTQTEGCVADDDNAVVFMAEEGKGSVGTLWKYNAEPTAGNTRTKVDDANGHANEDLEGVTIYHTSSGGGYIILSSQGASEFDVYQRQAPHSYVTTFSVQGASGTDGTDVTSVPLGPSFPQGLFLAHSGGSVVRGVPWQIIANGEGLTIDTSWDPRGGQYPTSPPPTSGPTATPTRPPSATNTPTPTTPSGTATLSISPSSSSISSIGGTRTVNINVANAIKLGGFEYEVHYNPGIVRVNSNSDVTLGSFLGSTGRSATMLTPVIDNVNGIVKVGAFSFGSQQGPNGSGTLTSITFTGVGNGTSSLSIQNILLSSSDTTPVNQPTTTQGGSVTVGSGGPTNTPGPGGTPTHEQTVTGTATGVTTVSSSSMTGSSGNLYLASIATRPNVSVVSVSGMGLNWTRVKQQCSGRNATGVEIWKGIGSPSNGTVTANLAASANAVISVSRYANVDSSSPTGNSTSTNTNGVNGGCSGGSDSTSVSYNLSIGSGNIIYQADSMRNKTFSAGSGYTERSEDHAGSSGDVAGLATADSSPSVNSVSGTFSASVDWASAALEIRGGGGTYPTSTPSQGSGGDANNDGYVDGIDFVYWYKHSSNADFNGSGSVDTADYVIWFNNYNQVVPTIPVASPTTPPNATNTPSPTRAPNATNTPTPRPTNTPNGPTPTFPPPQPGSGIWTSANELSSKPMSGDAWNAVKSAADSLSSNPTPDLDNQDDNTNVNVLAAAIVYARTGNTTYRNKVVNALQYIEGFTPNGRTLAWARETGAYALSADLVGYRTSAFEKKMRDMAETYIGSQTNKNLLNMFKMRPNNWGSQAFGSLTAIYRYLGDNSRLNEVRSYMIQSITGPKPSQASYGSLTWQCNESDPRWINPKGCTKNCGGTVNVDGIIPDDMRRGGSCTTSPGSTGYPWEGLQGFTMGAYILERAGLSIWGVDNSAICRAYAALEGGRFGSSWKASGDDEWQLPFADHGCGTNWAASHGNGKWDAGKNTGWGYVLP